MGLTTDLRVPVILGVAELAGAGDALLEEGVDFAPAASAGHLVGCACCAGRSPAGQALAELLHARARGRVPFFSRVVAVARTGAGRAEVEAALAGDPVASSCYRLVS